MTIANPIGPQFSVGESETLADNTRIYSVHSFAIVTPHKLADDSPEPEPERTPLRRLGRIWETKGYGWVAAPVRLDDGKDNWGDEVNRAVRFFASERDACMFLFGHISGVGAVRLAEKMASMPWNRAAEKN